MVGRAGLRESNSALMWLQGMGKKSSWSMLYFPLSALIVQPLEFFSVYVSWTSQNHTAV
jgi:hypothetical protein